jgi:hypothetical protein
MLWDERTEHIGSERPFLSQMTRFLPWITRTYKKPPRGAMPVESSAIEGDMGPLMVETVDPAYDPRGEPPRGVDGTLQHDMFVFTVFLQYYCTLRSATRRTAGGRLTRTRAPSCCVVAPGYASP